MNDWMMTQQFFDLFCKQEETKAMKTFRVWKNFRDPRNDIAVLVDAENESLARETAIAMLQDEHGFGCSMEDEKPIDYTVECL